MIAITIRTGDVASIPSPFEVYAGQHRGQKMRVAAVHRIDRPKDPSPIHYAL